MVIACAMERNGTSAKMYSVIAVQNDNFKIKIMPLEGQRDAKSE